MALKKRLTTFVSNWLGVIIAVVIVIVSATFGGMYLYARSRLDNAINFATQAITLKTNQGFTRIGAIDSPPPYTYQISLQVYNPYADTIDVTVSDISVVADTSTFTVVQDGSWNQSAATGYTYFTGHISISADAFSALAKKGKVDVDIKGTISGSGQYKWVKRQSVRPFSILIPGVLFQLNS